MTLFSVLVIFDAAYLARCVCSFTLFRQAYTGQYNAFNFRLATLCPAIFLDALPLIFVMWTHHVSYKQADVPTVNSDRDYLYGKSETPATSYYSTESSI